MKVDDAWSSALGSDSSPPHAGLQLEPTAVCERHILSLEGDVGKLKSSGSEVIEVVLSPRRPDDGLDQFVVAAMQCRTSAVGSFVCDAGA